VVQFPDDGVTQTALAFFVCFKKKRQLRLMRFRISLCTSWPVVNSVELTIGCERSLGIGLSNRMVKPNLLNRFWIQPIIDSKPALT